MSNKERVLQLLEDMPDGKFVFVIHMLEWISGNQVLKETGQNDYSLKEELKIIHIESIGNCRDIYKRS